MQRHRVSSEFYVFIPKSYVPPEVGVVNVQAVLCIHDDAQQSL